MNLAALVAAAAAALSLGGPVQRPHAPAAPAAARPASKVVWAVGDVYPFPAGKALARRVRAQRVDRFLFLGDVYETGTAAEWDEHYDPLYGPLAAKTVPTLGNHEDANRASGSHVYWQRTTGRVPADWFATRVGGWEILVLNSEQPHGEGSAQLAWLRAQVAGRRGTCRIAIWHRPRWSTGYHGSQADMAPLWDALVGHARLVLSGHDHDMQRFADRSGLRQYVSGAGGRPNIPLTHRESGLVFANRTEAGALRMLLGRGRARLAFVSAGGAVLDRSAARCVPLR